jgi:hypothetical protein
LCGGVIIVSSSLVGLHKANLLTNLNL